MRETNHIRGRVRDKLYFFKFCDEDIGGCGKKFRPTSRAKLCDSCKEKKKNNKK